MRKLAVIPMYKNGGMKKADDKHGKPVAYEVHDVSDEYITRFPTVIDDAGFERQTMQGEVTFKSEAKAQAWIDEQAERESK